MKIRELIQRVQSLYSKGVHSDDTRLSSRHIYNKLLSVRNMLVTQQARKKQRISQWNYQTLSCIELIETTSHNCPCIPPIGCTILRSKEKLPKPLTNLSNYLIQSVTTIDRSEKIDELNINAVKFQKGNKFTQKKVNYFFQDGYLYISTPTKIRYVALTGLFENPLDVEKYPSACNNEDCVDCNDCIDIQDKDFPIDEDMVDTLLQISLQELLHPAKADYTNNSQDNTLQQPTQSQQG